MKHDHSQFRTDVSDLSACQMSVTILSLARKNPDQRTSYKEIWDHYCPDVKWGHHSLVKLRKPFALVSDACIDDVDETGSGIGFGFEWPLITALIVGHKTRKHSEAAIANMVEFVTQRLSRRGQTIGDPQGFVEQQAREAAELTPEQVQKAWDDYGQSAEDAEESYNSIRAWKLAEELLERAKTGPVA